MIHHIKFLPVLLLLLCAGLSLNAQTDGATWVIDCQTYDGEIKGFKSMGMQMEKKYLIGHGSMALLGTLYAINNSGSYRRLNVIEILNGYDAGNLQQPWWFTTGAGLSADPGEKASIQVHFIGKSRDDVWVEEGIFESRIKLQDEGDGTIYEIPVTVYAVNPTKK